MDRHPRWSPSGRRPPWWPPEETWPPRGPGQPHDEWRSRVARRAGWYSFLPIWMLVWAIVARPPWGSGRETSGGVYELGGPRYWTYREITSEVLSALGKRRLIVPIPVALIRLVAGTSELVRLPFPVATDQLRQLRLDNIGPLDLIPRRFGFEPRPMEGALTYLRTRRSDQLATVAAS